MQPLPWLRSNHGSRGRLWCPDAQVLLIRWDQPSGHPQLMSLHTHETRIGQGGQYNWYSQRPALQVDNQHCFWATSRLYPGKYDNETKEGFKRQNKVNWLRIVFIKSENNSDQGGYEMFGLKVHVHVILFRWFSGYLSHNLKSLKLWCISWLLVP